MKLWLDAASVLVAVAGVIVGGGLLGRRRTAQAVPVLLVTILVTLAMLGLGR